MDLRPFLASFPSQTITVAGASAATALNGPAGVASRIVELQNAGTATVFVDFGASGGATAVATGYPILAGQSKLVTIPVSATHIHSCPRVSVVLKSLKSEGSTAVTTAAHPVSVM